MRVLVTGSRDWDRPAPIEATLSYLYAFAAQTGQPMVVVHGGHGRGGDRIAADWAGRAIKAGAQVVAEPHPVSKRQWDTLGRAAGPLRNKAMVALGANVCVAFNRNESTGTRGCADLAHAAGIFVWYHVYDYPAPPPPTRFDLKLNP